MTRINCIPVKELTDKHLLAEYRELPRVFKLARANANIPETYRMGKGHVTFFYDKLDYLFIRQYQIYNEMVTRGFKPNFHPSTLCDYFDDKKDLWNGWQPTEKAMSINRQRINERLSK